MITKEQVESVFKQNNNGVEEYIGSTADYFRDNFETIEYFLKKAKSKKARFKSGKKSDEALSKFIYEVDGVCSTSGTMLSSGCIRQYIKNTRAYFSKRENTNKKSLVLNKSNINLLETKKIVVSKVNEVKEKQTWTYEEYKAEELKLKKEGWVMSFYNEKAVYYYNLYERNRYENIQWNDELEKLWIITNARYPELVDKMENRRFSRILEKVLYGDFYDFLVKNRP